MTIATPERKRVALWIRVSSDDQDVETQREQLTKWVFDRGLDLTKTYEVHESAWRGHHHDELRAMYRDASLGAFDRLAVVAVDRLHRGGAGQTLGVWNELVGYDVQLMSMREPFIESVGTLGRALAELLLMIVGWYAQLESELISQRTKAGLDRRRAQGLPVGRQPGAKDRKQRTRRGYQARHDRERRERL